MVSGGASFAFDPAGRLYASTLGSTSTTFSYDGADITGEHNIAGTLLRRYVHGPGVDEPLVWYEGTGTTDRRFLLADERGSVASVTDAAGNPIANNTYDEYGKPGASNLGRFQYTGQAWLPEAGLYHYKARAYAANIGRFLQTDPIGFEGGMNLYAYVGNDPVNFADPTGTTPGGFEPTPNNEVPTGCSRLPDGSDVCPVSRCREDWVCVVNEFGSLGSVTVGRNEFDDCPAPILRSMCSDWTGDNPFPPNPSPPNPEKPYRPEPFKCSSLREQLVDTQRTIEGADSFLGLLDAAAFGAGLGGAIYGGPAYPVAGRVGTFLAGAGAQSAVNQSLADRMRAGRRFQEYLQIDIYREMMSLNCDGTK